MKILHVSHFFPPHMGGGETYLHNLCEGLVKANCDVKVITSNIPKSRNHEVINGIEVLRLPTKVVCFTPIMPSLAFELTKLALKFKPDIIHSHMPPPYAADVAALFCKVRRIPYILTYYTDVIAPGTMSMLLANLYSTTIGRTTLHAAIKIITPTSIIKNTSKPLKYVSNKVVVIPNGVDLEKFNPDISGEKVRQKFRIADQEKLLLFVGRLTFYKGVEYLLMAFPLIKEKVRDVKLIIVGEGYLKARLRSLCSSLQINDSVIFVGEVADTILPEYYAAADLFVLPSVYRAEGFGIVLIEAMASGKPVVASKVGGIPEVVQNDRDGILVTPRKSKELANLIIDLLLNPKRMKKMGQEGRKKVEKRFCWKRVVDRTLSLYQEVL